MLHSNIPVVKKLAQLTTWSSSLRFVSAADHHTAERHSKTGRTKPRKPLPRSNLSWNTGQNFQKTQSLWKSTLKSGRRCFSKDILELNVTPNISRSSDSFSTVSSIVNGGDWDALSWLRGNNSLSLTNIQFHSSKVSPPTNLAEVTVQGLCNCNSNARGWHTSCQSNQLVVGVTSFSDNRPPLRAVIYFIETVSIQENIKPPVPADQYL